MMAHPRIGPALWVQPQKGDLEAAIAKVWILYAPFSATPHMSNRDVDLR
jgi:hypothetical protein